VSDVPNPNVSGFPAERLFFSVQNNGHPTLCASKGCALSFVDTPWEPSTTYKVGEEILVVRPSTNLLYVNVAIAQGTSGSAAPAWPAAVGSVTSDNGIIWLNQGPTTVTPLANWTASHAYAVRTRIIDSNGNVQIVNIAGTSGATTPVWRSTAGGTTNDGTVTWVNAGVLPSAALPSTGGTSGIIFDNTVGPGTLAGASQVYFSTLGNQVCGTSGTGGCAIQASQSALK
jgi:hypothetical protein